MWNKLASMSESVKALESSYMQVAVQDGYSPFQPLV